MPIEWWELKLDDLSPFPCPSCNRKLPVNKFLSPIQHTWFVYCFECRMTDKSKGGDKMAFNVTKTETQVVMIPNGMYVAQVSGISEATGTGKFGKWYALKFQFTLFDQNPEINNKPVSGMVFYKMINNVPSINPGDKLDSWLTALGITVSMNTQFDVEKLVGAPCYVKVENSESGGKDRKSVV